MKRQFISEIANQESVNDVFRVAGKQLRPNRHGNLYLQVELSDRTGTMSALLWNASESLYRSFENGEFVRAEGTAQVYQGAMQMIATKFTKVPGDELDEEDFVARPRAEVAKYRGHLEALLRTLSDPQLVQLAETFLHDDALMSKFCRAPAGIKNHHAYHGGLLEHVVSLMRSCKAVAASYPCLDPDLLLMGAFLHDIGKIDELEYDMAFTYSDEGQLIGHIVMAVGMLDQKVRETEERTGETVPRETVLRLKHMIVSHHGEYEFGSPKLPMTLEAVALHFLDNLDAKLHTFQQQMCDDPNSESPWTNFIPAINRKLFKGNEGEAATRAVPVGM